MISRYVLDVLTLFCFYVISCILNHYHIISIFLTIEKTIIFLVILIFKTPSVYNFCKTERLIFHNYCKMLHNQSLSVSFHAKYS